MSYYPTHRIISELCQCRIFIELHYADQYPLVAHLCRSSRINQGITWSKLLVTARYFLRYSLLRLTFWSLQNGSHHHSFAQIVVILRLPAFQNVLFNHGPSTGCDDRSNPSYLYCVRKTGAVHFTALHFNSSLQEL